MNELQLTDRFDSRRPKPRAAAYRILGSLSEADDAVQETWIRLQRTDAEQLDSPHTFPEPPRAQGSR